ncbi:MAG TPA: branched-chain amino acid ABC transporter permease [Stellaceae bacterium]|nr:branched-chain amino acid ABC transporter permease [Stellaceae bacterium]
MKARAWYRALPWLAAALLVALAPILFRSGFALTLMSQMGIAILFALSYNMLLGQTGLLSFGHAVLLGLGGFIAMHALRAIDGGELPLPVPFLPLVGALGGLGFGALFGYLATRRAGTAFSMITLGLAELVAASSLTLRVFFGGEEGINGDRTGGPAFLGLDLGPQIEVYYTIAIWGFLGVGAMYALSRTPLGRMALAVRENAERVAFIGYDPGRIRFLMFTFSGFFAGLAGGLYAINYEIVTGVNLGTQASGLVLLMTYIGGVGHFIGPILGAILMTFLQINLASYTDAWILYLGLLFIAMVMFAPQGIAGLILMHEPLWRARLLHRLVPSYAMALGPAALLALGVVLIVEMSYRLSLAADKGPLIPVFGIEADARSFLSWGVALALVLGGAFLLRVVGPRVAERWRDLMGMARGGAV